MCAQGEAPVATAITEVIAAGGLGTLPLRASRSIPPSMEVSEALRGYVVESARAGDYDVLLVDDEP